MLNKDQVLKPEIIFVIISLIFGTAFALITPMFQVPDEPTHYLKVINLVGGQIFSGQSKVFIDLYSPVAYVVPAGVLYIGKMLNGSVKTLFYFGRLSNLFFYIIILYLAIKLTPVMKWVFLLLGLMPMSIYEAASFSSDGFNIAISFLLIAFIFKLALDDNIIKIHRNQILLLILLGALLALSKQVYVLILFLFFMIPLHKYQSRKNQVINFAGIFIISIIILMIWRLLAAGIYVPISNQISVLGQLSFIISNPLSYLGIFLNTILQNLTYYLTTFVGSFGWIDNGLDTPLPNILVYLYIIALIFAALTDNVDININLNQKVVSVFTYLITFASIFTLEYLMWTVVANKSIDGVFGRYFIPIAPMFFLLLHNKRIKDLKGKNLFIVLFALIVLSISAYMIYNRFY
jgi:uncharacterized membrane protein